MATTAQSILHRVVEQLGDLDGTHWPIGKLVRDLNDGQRDLIAKRPDAATQTLTTVLVSGARQTLPTTAAQLIDIPRNSASKKALRKVDMAQMDAVDRNWQTKVATLDADHFMYDLREPRVFYVYPPALVTSSLDLVCSVYPTNIVELGVQVPVLTFANVGVVTYITTTISNPTTAVRLATIAADKSVTLISSTITGGANNETASITHANITVADQFANALQDWCLYRAWIMDAEFANNAERAAGHLALYKSAIGEQAQASGAMAPKE